MRCALLVVSVLALATLDAAFGRGQSAATTFGPILGAALSNPAPGANADINLSFTINAPDSRPEALLFFTPPQFVVPADAAIPDGATVGTVVNPYPRYSYFNNACVTPIALGFTMLDATTDASNLTFDGFEDIDGDGLHDAVTRYPYFLTYVFPGLTPRARMYGDTVIAGENVAFNIVVFEPGTPVSGLPVDPALGYPSALLLGRFADPYVYYYPHAVSDFCTPVSFQTTVRGVTADNANTAANEGGLPYRTNPGVDGTFNFVSFMTSVRDADGDGIENSLDSCPFSPNAGNPRVAFSGDADGDGLDVVCDPNDSSYTNDQDGDQYWNRQDNCPLYPNGVDLDFQYDSDHDYIGQPCDPLPYTPNGHFHHGCAVSGVVVGSGGTELPSAPQLRPPCAPGPVDSDMDLTRDVTESGCGSNWLDPFSIPERADTAFDDDGDAAVNEPLSTGSGAHDCDGDGFAGSAEAHVFGSVVGNTVRDQDPCGNNGWPADVFTAAPSANKLTLSDLASFIVPLPKKLNTDPGDSGYDVRWDLVPGNGAAPPKDISLQDMAALTVLGAATANPPMFGGAPALNKTCPWPP